MKITWIRHGHTEQNEKQTYYGDLEVGLSQLGKTQIKMLKKSVVKQLLPNNEIKIYVSPKIRCVETAIELFKNSNFCFDERLVERHMGVWEGKTYKEIEEKMPDECKAWNTDWIFYKVPEGESAKEQYDRVVDFIKDLETQNEDTIVVAHGGTIKMALAYMLGQNIEHFWKFEIHPATCVTTSFNDGFWFINEIVHTPISHIKREQIILVTGGSRSGKSYFAEQLLDDEDDVLYIATAKVTDEEMAQRILKHQERRNPKWKTHEGYQQLDQVIKSTKQKAILLDCVTILTSNFMFEKENFEELSKDEQQEVLKVIIQEMQRLIDATRISGKQLILVTNEVGNGVVPAYPLGRVYRDFVGSINQAIAKEADAVYEVKCGISVRLK